MPDIPGNSTTTSTIVIGGSASDSLEFVGDHDWYRIELLAGQKLTVSLDGISLEDSYLRIYDSFGALLDENDDIQSGVLRDSKLVFTAPSTGTYYIDVGAFDDAYAGSYQLNVDLYTPPPVATYAVIAEHLTSGFWSGDSHHFNATQGGTITVNLTPLTAAGRNLAREALALWSDVIGITFTEVASGGQITFDDNQSGAFSEGAWSDGIIATAHVNVSTQWLTSYGTTLNSYSFQTYIHEIGHALGLGHGGYYNGSASFEDEALFANDGWPSTVMSYFDQDESIYYNDLGFTNAYVATPMLADIRAMGTLYGLSTTTRTGDTIYGFGNTSGRAVYSAAVGAPLTATTIFDSGGIDTLDYSGFASNQIINLEPEAFSNIGGGVGNLAIAFGTLIENALGGSGSDTINGNSANNVLTGNGGDDNLNGLGGNDMLIGGLGSDRLDGGAGSDTLYFQHGGNDTGLGGDGNDGFFFGAALDPTDVADGGAGSDDQVGLQGNYAPGTTINAANFAGIETFALLGGNITTFGDPGTNFYDYNLTTTSSFGRNIIVNANGLRAGEDFTFNGAAEATGSFTFYGGFGVETLTGGAGNDGFYFGPGRWGASDSVNGGGGSDNQLGLRGDFTITFGASQLTNIQTIALLSDLDPNFTQIGDGEFDYSLVLSDGNVGAGQQLTVSGGGLGATETMVVNGAAETNGTLRLIGGAAADTLTGGGGADTIFGGLGADILRGNGGADTFIYSNVNQSATGGFDSILDFAHNLDKVNLAGIDANTFVGGDHAFSFVGSAAFSGTGAASAGELRAYQADPGTNLWQVEADTNGDGIADFVLQLTVQAAQQITVDDFFP